MKIKSYPRFGRKGTIFHLNGGIGNQLFGYTAGRAFSKVNNTGVSFDLSDIGKGFSSHDSSIQTLSLNFEIAPSKNKIQMFGNRVLNKLDRVAHKYTSKRLMSFTTYRSHEIGFDSTFLNKRKIRNVHGYFQSWKYLESAYESFPPKEFTLREPSKWFLDNRDLAIAANPIIIHVRRGDYNKLVDTYGLLSSDYYKAALLTVRKLLADNPIWIFSDDIDEAKKSLSAQLPIDTRWVNPPLGNNPVESLVLMSLGAANIIANSTFSWWGAILNRDSAVTVAPQKWFRGMTDPKDLYPPHWIQVQSSWVI